MDYPKYRIDKTYDWNYDNAPNAVETQLEADRRPDDSCEYVGIPTDSPIGIAAGPLLNGKWILYYASLGFSVLTYKTVRSAARACYPTPNLTPVETGQLAGSQRTIPASEALTDSWAVSFGMPSKEPSVWRADVESTRTRLPKEKILAVSVVGSMQPDWTIDELADDYAQCAKWAVESGADCVETNFSCPNVSTCDGQLYQNALDAGTIAERVRGAIGNVPLLIKIGHFPNLDTNQKAAESILHAIAKYANGIVTTNSVATTVADADGTLLFNGQARGICGEAIRRASIQQTSELHQIIERLSLPLQIVGVGGINSANHTRDYLNAGAHAVQLATAVMLDPLVGLRIRAEL